MKFRLISRQGVDEGTGEIADPFAGAPWVLVWNGRTFCRETMFDQGPVYGFHEELGQALDHHQVKPPPKVAERWTSPTAIGRMAEKAPDVVDSVAPGYVLRLDGVTSQEQARRLAEAADPCRHVRRRGEPS